MAIAISLIGTIGTIIVAYLGVKATKEAAVSEKDLQDAIEGANRNVQKEIAQKYNEKWEEISSTQIDADLKAKARIEWIQNVRIISSELVSDIYNFKNENSVDIRYEIKRKSELLKLYFNSVNLEEESNLSTDELIEILKSETSNNQKNGYLNVYISRLCDALVKENYLSKREEIKLLNEQISQNYNEIYSLREPITAPVWVEEVDDEVEMTVDWEILENNRDEANEIFRQISSKKARILLLEKELNEEENLAKNFVQIISIYLKLEWDKAKEGK